MALNRQAHPDNASAVRASSVSANPFRTEPVLVIRLAARKNLSNMRSRRS